MKRKRYLLQKAKEQAKISIFLAVVKSRDLDQYKRGNGRIDVLFNRAKHVSNSFRCAVQVSKGYS